MSVYVLVHGSWHDGSAFDDVARELRGRGHDVHCPTMAGHGKEADRDVTHDDCVDSVLQCLRENDLRDVVLVGHSFGGSVVARVALLAPELVRRMVFWAGFVPANGTSVLDNTPPAYQELFPMLASASADNSVMLPFEVWRDCFIGDADYDRALETYGMLVPEPLGPTTQKLILDGFDDLQIPRSYVLGDEDCALPPHDPQYGYHAMARRLGAFRFVTYRGAHETLFTDPELIAETIERAGRD
ncbi:alpha/beta hydrolase [Alloalcanivorax gelatiniphagus]